LLRRRVQFSYFQRVLEAGLTNIYKSIDLKLITFFFKRIISAIETNISSFEFIFFTATRVKVGDFFHKII
jgi:hypothetical protein